ncbi:hypothetical protein, partial [Pseudomonas sp. URMO17WK12:I2]|uniref:hypothetical protein n=1 Tax=Pseudomonas sp. URMO17WK12:I2 TaxID=1261623 RepID=UPI001C44D2FA
MNRTLNLDAVGAGHASECITTVCRAHGALPQISSAHLNKSAFPVGAGHARDCSTAFVRAHGALPQV